MRKSRRTRDQAAPRAPTQFPPALMAELERDLNTYEAELRKGIEAHLKTLPKPAKTGHDRS